MVEDSSELDELLASPNPRRRPKKLATKAAKGQQATPTRAKQTEEAPPDTAVIVRRTRPVAKAATAKATTAKAATAKAATAKEAAPKSR
ncbi:hypothetical protein IW136_005936, partial [Coemansia sp. RSA 678]